MKISSLQLNIQWEDKLANYDSVKHYLDRARLERNTLLLLPEMFATGFSMNVTAISEPEGGPTELFLAQIARDYGLFVLGGVVTRGKTAGGRNEAVVFEPTGRLLARYCKNYPFTLGGESAHYEAGKEILSFDWLGCRVAPFICYDLRFPEVFRAAVRQGAQVFAVIASWPNKRESHWTTLLRARAIENQAFVASANRCGKDPQFDYSGRSVMVNPHGEIVADAGNGEGVITAAFDLEALETWRRDFPALADMR